MSSLFKEASATESSMSHVRAQLAGASDLKEETVACVTVLYLSFGLHEKSRRCGRGGREPDTPCTLSFLRRCTGQDHGSWGSCVCKRSDTQKSIVNSPSCPQIWKVSHVPHSFCPGLFQTSVLLSVTLDASLSSWTPETHSMLPLRPLSTSGTEAKRKANVPRN